MYNNVRNKRRTQKTNKKYRNTAKDRKGVKENENKYNI